MSPEQAGDLIRRAIVERPSSIMPWWATAGAVVGEIARGPVAAVMRALLPAQRRLRQRPRREAVRLPGEVGHVLMGGEPVFEGHSGGGEQNDVVDGLMNTGEPDQTRSAPGFGRAGRSARPATTSAGYSHGDPSSISNLSERGGNDVGNPTNASPLASPFA